MIPAPAAAEKNIKSAAVQMSKAKRGKQRTPGSNARRDKDA